MQHLLHWESIFTSPDHCCTFMQYTVLWPRCHHLGIWAWAMSGSNISRRNQLHCDCTLCLCQNSYGKWTIYSWFTYYKWWFSIAILNDQRVYWFSCHSSHPSPNWPVGPSVDSLRLCVGIPVSVSSQELCHQVGIVLPIQHQSCPETGDYLVDHPTNCKWVISPVISVGFL